MEWHVLNSASVTMTSFLLPELDSEMRAFLEAAGIIAVTEARSLRAEEVDRLLSSEPVRCVMTDCIHGEPRWLAPLEQDKLWQEEVRPRLVRNWAGWYEVWEWRTDRHETLILFMHCYVPI